jgi:hypothetical protein
MEIKDYEKELTLPNLNYKYLKKELFKNNGKGQLLALEKMNEILISRLINYCDYDVRKLEKLIAEERGHNLSTVKNKVGNRARRILSNFDVKELKEKRKANRKELTGFNRQVNTIKEKARVTNTFLNYFNIKGADLEKTLQEVAEKGSQNSKDYLQELYALRVLFLAKAKGDIVTKTTNITYEVTEDKEGNIIKKRVRRTSEGKQYIEEQTKSYLPDEKALVGLKIVDDLILQVETRENVEVTPEELEDMYEQARKRAEEDRKIYIAEIIE